MHVTEYKYTNRLWSLDVFRGFTVALMMIVNNPGSWKYVYHPLRHAAWHGCTIADFVFPFFIWIIGASMVFSFASCKNHRLSQGQLLKKAIIRSIVLFAAGLFLNSFPFGLISGHDFSWAAIRIPGVLQRIAICCLVVSIIVIYTKTIWQIMWLFFFLISYWLLIKFVPVPGFGSGILEPMGNLAWYIDANLLHGHTWAKAPALGFDPEGVLGTLPAIATMLFGVLTGNFLRLKMEDTKKAWIMIVAGSIFVLIGLLMSIWLPINKNLWTSSYAVFTSGMALICFTIFYWTVDVNKNRKQFKPFQILGLNALVLYVISGIVLRLTYAITVPSLSLSLKNYYYTRLFPTILDPMFTSFLHAIAFLAFIYLIAYVMYRKRVIVKA